MIKIKDDELFHNDWVSLRKVVSPDQGIKGYVYSHETRCDGQIISIMPYQRVMVVADAMKDISKRIGHNLGKVEWRYLMKSEATPCWGITKKPVDLLHQFLSTLTGGVEDNKPTWSAIHELKEEAGYEITLDQLIYLGTCFASKSSDTIYQLYSVDLTDIVQGEAEGDGSALEKAAKPVWVDDKQILKSPDPLASVLLLRLQEYLKKHERFS